MPCTCSAEQLHLVGCDCAFTRDAVVAHVWKDGYASDNKGRIYVDGGDDVATAVLKDFGPLAKAYQTKRINDAPRYSASAGQAAAMSRADNS